jgi:hypothetical protein
MQIYKIQLDTFNFMLIKIISHITQKPMTEFIIAYIGLV